MALRTPRADGLTTGPNAAGDANNPAASSSELLAHRFWGRYATVDDLPNAAANAAGNPAFSLMRPGDVAWVQADGLLYQLQDRGTLAGNDAVWAPVGSGSGAIANPIDWFNGTTELWKWNQLDLTQLDIANPLVYQPSSGAAVAGSITPSVALGAGRRGENLLTFTTVGGFRGGWVYRLLDDLGAPFSLPTRYYIYARYAIGGAAFTGGGVIVPWGIESPSAPGYVEGPIWFFGEDGAQTFSVNIVHFDGVAATQNYFAGITRDLDQFTLDGCNPNDLARQYIGGSEGSIQARRQIGADPTADWWVRTKHRYDNNNNSEHEFYRMGIQMVRAGVAGASDPTSWNGLDMSEAMIGYNTGNTLTGPSCAFSDVRIYSFNPDAPGT